MFRPIMAILRGAIYTSWMPWCIDCTSEDGQDWPKHVGKNLILFYCILYHIVYRVGFTVISKWLVFCMEYSQFSGFLWGWNWSFKYLCQLHASGCHRGICNRPVTPKWSHVISCRCSSEPHQSAINTFGGKTCRNANISSASFYWLFDLL